MLDFESRHLVCDNRHTVRVKLFQFGFIILFWEILRFIKLIFLMNFSVEIFKIFCSDAF